MSASSLVTQGDKIIEISSGLALEKRRHGYSTCMNSWVPRSTWA